MSTCRACGERIVFAVVGNKQGRPPSRMPLNPDPDPAGNVAVYKEATGALVGRVLGKDKQPLGYERLMMPHFATCPKRSQPQQLPQNVTQLDAWRKAAAAHGRAQRQRRGKRPAPPITGIRINPRSTP
jgi:hypothetical protein